MKSMGFLFGEIQSFTDGYAIQKTTEESDR
jgi:hypothetical protein